MSGHVSRVVATEGRLLGRSCQALIGICAGLSADGDLNDKEIAYLSTWLSENAEIATTWPGEVVHARVRDVLVDGFVSDEERVYLLKTLQDLTGDMFSETGSTQAGSAALPINPCATITLAERSFCFTGEFIFGTRNACERAVEQRGGFAATSLTKKTNFLVVGEMASRSWKNTSHGTKIEKAIELRSSGVQLEIVSEAHWVRALAIP